MADLPGLEDLLLSGFDVSALLAGAPPQAPGQALLGLEAHLQLKPSALSQQAIHWPTSAPANQNDIYQKVAQSLAAKLEEHRLQQVQVATALQQLQALQQQQELAQLQQQLSALHQQVPRTTNPFQRSRTTDLESLGRGPSYDMVGTYAQAIDFEQQQKQLVALQQAANPTTPLVGLQRIPGVVNQHSLPVRSFSSEHLVTGQRRPPPHLLANAPAQLSMQGLQNGKRPPIRQPSGLGPNDRSGSGSGGQGRSGDGGRRARYAATAQAPSWASEDWHPMKAVLASGAHASGGTGVFLPHLAAGNNNSGNSNNNSNASSSMNSGIGPSSAGGSGSNGAYGSFSNNALPQRGASTSSGGAQAHGGRTADRVNSSGPLADAAMAAAMAGIPPASHISAMHALLSSAAPNAAAAALVATGTAAGVSSSSTHSPLSPLRDGSPSCSVDSNAAEPYSRQTTMELSRGSTHSELDSHPPSAFGYLADTMKVVVEEPEREREDANEECDFVSLARELAELMSKQTITE